MGTIVVMLTREPMNTLCNWVELIGSDQFSLCAVSKPLISKSVSKCICKKNITVRWVTMFATQWQQLEK